MTADSASREDIRKTFAGLLEAALLPSLVDKVYRAEEENVETGPNRAIVMVLSGGTKRRPSGIADQRWRNYFLLQVLVFVDKPNTLSTVQGGTNWTAENVEDKLDRLDQAIADVVADNRNRPTDWSYIDFTDEYSTIVEGRSRPYEPPETQQTKWKIESYTVEVSYLEKGTP